MNAMKMMVLALGILAAAGCGGGGGGGDNGGGSGNAISGRVPYLVSAPSLTFAVSAWDNTKYDVTVTLEADGPTGVLFVDLWIEDETNSSNFDHLDLTRIAGTRRWRGSTNTMMPLPAGRYRVDSIHLNDGDPITADPLRTGWYMIDNFFSTSLYFVDEREMSGMNFLYYNWGLSSFPVTRGTVTS
jgi:hypothetical protein